MLVTTATSGVYSSSEPSLSSASATKQSPLPWWALVPASPELAADRERRVEPAVLQRHDQHRRGRRLAVGAGDHQRGAPGHQLGQHRRPQHHRNAAAPGLDEFGVGLRDRGVGGDDRGGPPGSRSSDDASWPIRTCAPRARSACMPRDSLASDPDTSPPRSSRMRAMPDMPGSPDADHVHPAQLGRQLLGAHRRPSVHSMRRHRAPGARRPARLRPPAAPPPDVPASAAAAVIAASRGGVGEQPGHRARRRSPGSDRRRRPTCRRRR